MEVNKIYNEDCLVGMRRIPTKSIDAIICDLPYGVLNRSNQQAQWDQVIPFSPLWEQYERIIKDNGVIILFGQGMFTAQLMMSKPDWWRYYLVWDKQRVSNFLNVSRQPLRQTEMISVFCKNQPTYHPQMRYAPHSRNHTRGKMQGEQTNRCYGNMNKATDFISDEKYPTDLISIPKKVNKALHPTEKPVPLLEYLIRTYTNKGDLVLDNCMGSGTTAVAAINTQRNFIGFEINKEYYDIACKRVDIARRNFIPSLFKE